MNYESFIAQKRISAPPTGIEDPPAINGSLFPFQRDITRWALRIGKSAVWADCGLGKSWIALEWARIASEHTGKPSLILTPLAVAQQFIGEHEKLGSDFPIRIVTEASDVDLGMGINVCNYEKLHKLDASVFGAVVLDESSILKNFNGKTRNALIESFAATPFRLCCTATPAPNDFMELANHAEFLGAMTRAEMLAMFFVHDGGEVQKWRLKGHAGADFWKWICSWAVNVRKPSDLGYSDDGFDLPPLKMHEHVVKVDDEMARSQGMLFTIQARTLHDQRRARRMSMSARVELAAEMVNSSDEPWLVWCDLNAESDALAKMIPDAVEVKGAQSNEVKEKHMHAFGSGKARAIVTKPSISGWGMNWQHCPNVAFVGLSHSFEAWYQAVRRTYRFGQTKTVNCHMIVSDAEGAVAENLKRKQADAIAMADNMNEHMSELNRENLQATARTETRYDPRVAMTVPRWLKTEEAS